MDYDPSKWENFDQLGGRVSQFVVDYYRTLESRPVRAQVEPGFLAQLLPSTPPEEPESIEDILKDVDNKILPGVTHWQHPRFFGYYPAESSPPSLAGDIVSGMINCIAFSWEASPSATELETIMVDWLANLLALPDSFKSSSKLGGGMIQGTASEALLVALLAARERMLRRLRKFFPDEHDCVLMSKMTMYCSDQTHLAMAKAATIAGLRQNLRTIPSGAALGYRFDADELRSTVEKDISSGLVPIFVCATIGTTSTCASDDLETIGKLCREIEDKKLKSAPSIWLHVDGAYAGVAAICPEHREMMRGIEYADSLDVNVHKWLLTNFDASIMWIKDRTLLRDALGVTHAYLRSAEHDQGLVTDYRDMQIPLGRRFRSLKLWFVMRMFGARRMREHIRRHCALADHFASLVDKSEHFELFCKPRLGLVCFRVIDSSNEEMETIKQTANRRGGLFFISTSLEGSTVMRFAICSTETQQRHVDEAFQYLTDAVKTVRS